MGAMIPDHIKAQALALLATGLTPRQIAPELGVTWRCIYQWRQQALHDPSLEQEDKNQLIREYRIAELADNNIADALEYIAEQGPALGIKHLIAQNAIAGTMRDKIMKRKDSGKAQSFQNFVLVQVNAGSDVTVEAKTVATIEHAE